MKLFFQLAVLFLFALALSAVFTTPPRAVDSIGPATSTNMPCPFAGAPHGKCYKVNITGCAAGPFIAQVRLNISTAGTPIGTVLLTIGGGGNFWYDNAATFKVPGNCGIVAISAGLQLRPRTGAEAGRVDVGTTVLPARPRLLDQLRS